jgi:hypothetical protein
VITVGRSRFVPNETAIIGAALIARAPLETRVAFIEAMREFGDEIWSQPIFVQSLNAETIDLWESLDRVMLPFREFWPN